MCPSPCPQGSGRDTWDGARAPAQPALCCSPGSNSSAKSARFKSESFWFQAAAFEFKISVLGSLNFLWKISPDCCWWWKQERGNLDEEELGQALVTVMSVGQGSCVALCDGVTGALSPKSAVEGTPLRWEQSEGTLRKHCPHFTDGHSHPLY